MQTVNANVILEDAQRSVGWDIDQLETRQKQMTRQAFSMALQEIWEGWWWEELMLGAQFNGATVYTADTVFEADALCYFPATKKFYQAMQASTGAAPATLGADGSYATNFAYWAEAVAEPSAADYSATKTDYALGDQARSLVDGLVYQLFAFRPTQQVSGAGLADANGIYVYAGQFDGFPSYTLGNYTLAMFSTRWVIFSSTLQFVYSASDMPATPDLALGWYSTDAIGNPDPTYDPPPTITLALVANAPPDAASWRALIPFTPSIAPAGEVRLIGKHDLRNSNNSAATPFEKTLDGYRLPGWCEGVPWAWYRRAVPIIEGDEYDATATYTATPAANLAFP